MNIFAVLYRKTAMTGSLWVVVDTFKENSQLRLLPFDLASRLASVGWSLKDIIIWDKTKTLPWSGWGQLRRTFEYILFFAKTSSFEYYINRIKEPDNLKEWWVKYNLFYDLVKISIIRLAFAMARELRKRDIVSVALTPGFLRSEAVLDHFGVSEANWKEAGKKDPPGRAKRVVHDARADFMVSESPRYVGRAVVALAADPKVKKKSGRVFSSWALAREYGFTDLDGTRPDWGSHARKKYGKYKICDERFYSYWVPGLVELIFPDWF